MVWAWGRGRDVRTLYSWHQVSDLVFELSTGRGPVNAHLCLYPVRASSITILRR